jgi:single-strand DNA-binding protein
MLKIQMIGYLGRDAVVQQHGTESVINFSLCHTDKYKDSSGQKYEKATWVSCSWWVESTNVAQYLKKGTLIWAEGVPEAKNWKDKQGESKAFLNMRVMRVELLGGKRDDSPVATTVNTDSAGSSNDDELPF